MKLFELDDNKEVQINKAWILMVPEFKKIWNSDKGSKGDYRGDKKLLATRKFTYIYFFIDFSSPIRDWDDEKRKLEALRYAGISEEDLDDDVDAAVSHYMTMQYEASRPLRSLKSLYKGLDAFDQQMESINFTLKDKQGKLLNDPSDFVTNATKLGKMYDAIKEFEQRVETDLKNADTGIRGPNSTLGDNETQTKAWSEADILTGSHAVQNKKVSTITNFTDLMSFTKAQAKAERLVAIKEQQELEDKYNSTDTTEEEEEDELS